MTRWLGVGVLVLVVVVSGFAGQLLVGPVVAVAGPDAPVNPLTGPLNDGLGDGQFEIEDDGVDEIEFDRVQFWIEVRDDGSAEWTFRYERILENETEAERFEAFAQEFNENETYLYDDFRRQAEVLTDNGSDETDREMDAGAFEREARTGGLDARDDELGIVEMSFAWSGFAEVDDDRIIVGDVFRGGHIIFDNQSIVVEAGDGLAFERADPEPSTVSDEVIEDSDTLTWEGEQEFNDARPRVVLIPEDQQGPVEPSPTPTPTEVPPETNEPGEEAVGDDSGPWMAVAFGTVVLLGLAAAAVWQRRDDQGFPLPWGDAPDDDSSGAVAPAEPESPISEDELLTDEDRVITLLEDNGGRMKQVNIVKETGWSKSKVSMLLSDMEDEGLISKLRVGRENIISLDGQEPEAAGSPLGER